MPSPAIKAAYRATDYRVDDPAGESFVLRIGETSAGADRLLAAHGQTAWAFITACNPRSERQSDEENSRRMAELEAVLRDGGWPHYRGAGVSRDGTWPPEPSFLVVGISEAEALDLAHCFDQNAIVVGRTGEPARLIWAR
jgi:Protein of unknown function (DUF3293)